MNCNLTDEMSTTSKREQHAQKVADLCRYIESAEHSPALEELAERAGMSVYHLHRVFKAITGLTPKGYATAQRVAAGCGSAQPGDRACRGRPALRPASRVAGGSRPCTRMDRDLSGAHAAHSLGMAAAGGVGGPTRLTTAARGLLDTGRAFSAPSQP
jgi:AraC-like DNA-binding protein